MSYVSGSFFSLGNVDPRPETPPMDIEIPHPGGDDLSSDLSDDSESRAIPYVPPVVFLPSSDPRWISPEEEEEEEEIEYIALEFPDMQITYPRRSVAVEEIPVVALGAAELARGVNCCAVCVEDYMEEECVSRLPCGHYFHKDCISPWFKTRVTCPTCRFTLV